MKKLANYIKEYPRDVHPFKKLDDIEKYAEFMESKPVYDPENEFWKDFEEYDRNEGDAWILLIHENQTCVWWFYKTGIFEDHDGEELKSYEEIVRYILK